MARTVCSQLAQYIPVISTSSLEAPRGGAGADLRGVGCWIAARVVEPTRSAAADKPVTIEVTTFFMAFGLDIVMKLSEVRSPAGAASVSASRNYIIDTPDVINESLPLAGDVAKRLGIGVQTLHYYERENLIPPPPRSPGGFRRYPPEIVRRVEFIRKAQSLGLPLNEIREIIVLSEHGRCACGRVEAGLARQLADVDQRIAELKAFRRELSQLLDASRKTRRQQRRGAICAIVEDAPPVTPLRRARQRRRRRA